MKSEFSIDYGELEILLLSHFFGLVKTFIIIIIELKPNKIALAGLSNPLFFTLQIGVLHEHHIISLQTVALYSKDCVEYLFLDFHSAGLRFYLTHC